MDVGVLRVYASHVCGNATTLLHYILMAESSTVLTRTPNVLFTVVLVLSIRVTLLPSFTMYTSGSQYTPATASNGIHQMNGNSPWPLLA